MLAGKSMSEPKILKSLAEKNRKSMKIHESRISERLDTIEYEIKRIMEQTQFAKAFPVALVDSQRLQEIYLSTVKAYQEALKEILERFDETTDQDKRKLIQELKQVLEQTDDQFDKILGLLTQINDTIQKLGANADLEREVLTKLSQRLGA